MRATSRTNHSTICGRLGSLDPTVLPVSDQARCYVAALNDQGEVVLWDVQAGRRITVDYDQDTPAALALSPNGSLLAVAGEGFVYLWNRGTSKTIMLELPYQLQSLAFSQDGKLLVGGSDMQTFSAWSVPDMRLLATWGASIPAPDDWPWPKCVPMTGSVAVSIVEAGQVYRVATASWDCSVQVWRLELTTKQIPQPSEKRSAHFPPTTPVLASIGVERVYKTIGCGVATVSWSPDGRWLVGHEGGGARGDVYVWDMTSAPIQRRDRDDPFAPSVFDIHHGYAEERYSVRPWDRSDDDDLSWDAEAPLRRFFAWSPDSALFGTGHAHGLMHMWEIQRGACRLTLQRRDDDHVLGAWFLPPHPDAADRLHLLSLDAEGRLRRWFVDTPARLVQTPKQAVQRDNLESLVQGWLDQSDCQYSAQTAHNYRNMALRFVRWLHETVKSPRLRDVSRRRVDQFLDTVAPQRRRAIYGVLYSWGEWLVEAGYITEHPLGPPSPHARGQRRLYQASQKTTAR